MLILFTLYVFEGQTFEPTTIWNRFIEPYLAK